MRRLRQVVKGKRRGVEEDRSRAHAEDSSPGGVGSLALSEVLAGT